MAGTTANYAFNYPTSTDLVKDGATAIQTLATNVDTAMNNALSTKPAMGVLLNATSVTGVGSIIIDNVFSSAYKNYKIVIEGTSGSAAALLYKNVLSGTTATTNYSYMILYSNTGTAPSKASASGVAYIQCTATGNFGFNGEILMSNPALAQTTLLYAGSGRWQSATDFESFTTTGVHTTATAYTGFQLEISGGLFNATIRTYGLRNS